jgi:hypothetical protein
VLLQQLVKGSAALCTCRKECNKYDLIWLLLSVSDWRIIMIGPGGLLLPGSPPPICCPEYITKLGCEIYFSRVVTYSAPLEMML